MFVESCVSNVDQPDPVGRLGRWRRPVRLFLSEPKLHGAVAFFQGIATLFFDHEVGKIFHQLISRVAPETGVSPLIAELWPTKGARESPILKMGHPGSVRNHVARQIQRSAD